MRAGNIETPAFMPVGTQASVKSLTPEQVRQTGAQIILNNAYHLYLRPGVDLIERLGGLHRFEAWDGGILTDSGGYQIFSLSPLHKVSEEGLAFKSHLDGSEHFMTPEKAVEMQQRLGADILMSFDQPIPWGATREQTAEATRRTHRWAQRGKAAWRPETGQVLFGIVQGGFARGLAARKRGDAGGDGLPRLLHRRAFRRRAEGDDVGDARHHHPTAAGGQTALPDGGGHADRPGARGAAGGGHVRLRAAHAHGAQRHRLHLGGAPEPAQRAI